MSTPAVEVQGLSYAIGAARILDGVSFLVEAGSYLSIVGPNGAGKSTLLKCLNRIITGAAGRILIQGRSLADYSQTDLAIQVGYVPQGGADDVPFSVYEFVMMGRYPHLSAFTSPTADDECRVAEALDLAGASSLANRDYGTLSGGEKQRVLIAAALAQDARILLLDEPTTFLDPRHQHDILRLLARLNRDSGVTILAVTHDLNAAALSSDRVLALRGGAVVFHGSPCALMDAAVLRRLYEQEFHFVSHPVNGCSLVVPEAVR
ncbi:MAG: ABC transporter ATP-binding protein [Lentisphaeria bacterium]|nr:ABC transporter ATP-binding protein [Lentisphaeria bacterium]